MRISGVKMHQISRDLITMTILYFVKTIVAYALTLHRHTTFVANNAKTVVPPDPDHLA